MERLAHKKARQCRALIDSMREAEKRREKEAFITEVLKRNPGMPPPSVPLLPFNPSWRVPGPAQQKPAARSKLTPSIDDEEQHRHTSLSHTPQHRNAESSRIEPAVKRTKRAGELEDENVWLQRYTTAISIKVVVPLNPQLEKLGIPEQSLQVTDLALSSTVKELKQTLQEMLAGLAPAKQKLTSIRLGVLKDGSTLAYYNFVGGEELILGLKDRGGARK